MYQYRLATALVAAGRDAKAKTYLLGLWQRRPGDGAVNRELARLEARAGRMEEAVRYYQQAVHGSWETRDPVATRHEVRLELAEALVAEGSKAGAEAQLITLAAETSRQPDESVRLGELLLRVDAPRRALTLFRSALSERPRHAGALSGAGRAAFAVGEYVSARRYLERAVRERPDAGDLRLAGIAEQVLASDPFRPRLSAAERGRRAAAAWQAAVTRAANCRNRLPHLAPGAADTVQQSLEQLRPRIRPALLAQDADLLEDAMDRVFAAEAWASRECGEPQGVDLALGLIARHRSEAP
jgi:tetratricopeptide (TPR) repeat protein